MVQASRLRIDSGQAGRLHHKRGMSPATSLALAPGFRPMTKEQLLKRLKPVAPGDKLLVHAGTAIARLTEETPA